MLAVLGMGKISEKGILKEGYLKPCPASTTRFDLIITNYQKKTNFSKKKFNHAVAPTLKPMI